MTEFFLADFNILYSIALCFVIALAFIEGLGLIIGVSLMEMFGQFSTFDVDADIDVTSGGLTSVIGWLCLNRLPLLIWLVILLTSFGSCGIVINYITVSELNFVFPTYVTAIASLIFAIYFTKAFSKPLAKILPKNETSALSNTSFTGLVGKITVGKATINSPAEAVIQDAYKQKHYILVAPEKEDEVFLSGSSVVLLKKSANHWLAAPFETLD